ncbi:glycerophosphodiester phosphodiesterase [Paenibacillus endoradicis]|uniref:glycerophosphodiester phosphodiesterase n=1 Tax=Paenibacillus endoradicis TaxID=2972487 RepID=UPI002159000D|nr:glycerophosphodiester phosphodiesterase [Paenibacillus endoradicis]MCR8659364.1 glycerophosphodiester phosphodiesterase [Paenibacillus endoradicis]
MLRLLDRSIRDFRASYSKLLIFEYVYMLLTSFVIIPVNAFIFNRILLVVGSGSLLNDEVYLLGRTLEGVAGLIMIGLVASFALFIELCVLIILVQQRYFGKEIAISDALLTTLRQTPRLFGFGIFQLFLILLVLIPFIDSPLSASFYKLFNFPIFLQNQVLDVSYTMTFVYVLILIAALYTVLRGIFVLHFIVLEGNTIVEAIRNSLVLTRGKRLQLFIWLFLLNGLVLGTGFVVISSLSYLPSWLDINVLKVFSNHYSLTLSTILTYMFALLLMPINIIFLTRLFYYFGREKGMRLRNTLNVFRSRFGGMERRITNYLKKRERTRLLYATTIVVYIGLALFVGFKANDTLVYAKWSVLISAHRGDVESAPENSIPSIEMAIEKGIQSVELDVQLTKDGVAVLHHDYTLQRLAGVTERVSDLTYEEISKLSIGTDADMQPVHIPELNEVLNVAEGKIKLLLDLKPDGLGDELAKEVVELVQGFDMEEDVYIQSFDNHTLRQIRERAPEIKIGQILYFAFGDLSALDVDFYTVEQVMLTEQLVKRAHDSGREIWVWTVNSTHNMKEVLKFDVDGIITDHPVLAQSMVEIDL